MNRQRLWKVALTTTQEAEEAVMVLFQAVLGVAPSSYLDLDLGTLKVSAYVDFNPETTPYTKTRLRQGLARIGSLGLRIGRGRLAMEPVRRENWAESWKKHFEPIEIGSDLLIKPGWRKCRPRKGQAVVVLDPGLSFGTGHHPTTAFCLRQLVAIRAGNSRPSLLDVGTGSGILAIAAAKLGYAPILAFDNDPESVLVSNANAQANRVGRAIRIDRRDVTKLPLRATDRYSVVCANLVAPLLVQEHRRIVARVDTGGWLVLAGVLQAEFRAVRKVYEAAGLRLAASQAEKEWRSGSFRRIDG